MYEENNLGNKVKPNVLDLRISCVWGEISVT